MCFRFCLANLEGGGCGAYNRVVLSPHRRAASLRSLRSRVSSTGSVAISRRVLIPSAPRLPRPHWVFPEGRPGGFGSPRPRSLLPRPAAPRRRPPGASVRILPLPAPLLHRSRCPAAPGRGPTSPRLLPAAPLAPAG